ncbi:MAG: peptidylprolyl isomerase [Sphingomonas sp.]|nr:peptidylprolyl isomerase [Sphingomonas sp.]|tara:strand:+ start:310 stop:1641 length:1332 start_codon:yes stop_codon:yes gene_type:complete
MGGMAALALGLMALAPAAGAQTVPDDAPLPSTGLDLPSNLQIFGDPNPDVRKPTAVVNDTVITGTDIDERLAFVTTVNNFELSDEDKLQLRREILSQLIDETLQIQEAKANKIEVTPDQIDRYFAVYAQRNFNKTPEEMTEWLASIGSSATTVKRQIEGEISWQQLLRQQVQVNVSDDEVRATIDRIREARGTEEFHLKEIYISAPTPERQRQVYDAFQQMASQMREGTPFEMLARQYSEATTAPLGGDLGWVRAGMIPQPLAQAAQSMDVGQIAGPIDVGGGFSLLYLVDKRKVLTADPGDARLSLRQMTIRFPAGTSQAQATSLVSAFATATQAMRGCGDVAATAEKIGATVVDNDSMRVRDLPVQLRDTMQTMEIGTATQPFGSLDDGVSVLVLCGRDAPSEPLLPSEDQVRDQIEQQRTSLRAQRMLRDLRRDALIEYR